MDGARTTGPTLLFPPTTAPAPPTGRQRNTRCGVAAPPLGGGLGAAQQAPQQVLRVEQVGPGILLAPPGLDQQHDEVNGELDPRQHRVAAGGMPGGGLGELGVGGKRQTVLQMLTCHMKIEREELN